MTDKADQRKELSNWVSLLIVLTAPLLSVIDIFIINVAIPSVKRGLSASDAEIQLVIAGYLLGYASFLITGGRAGDHYGRKRVFLTGMFLFTLFSIFCGLSQTPLQLNLMRFCQGISAALMVPQTIAFIQILFVEKKERAKAIGLYGITLGLASIIGQALGGYFSQLHFFIDGWRLIFLVNLPIGIVSLWGANKYLRETKTNKLDKLDFSGVAILTVCLFCLIIPLIEGRENHWPWWCLALLVIAAIMMLIFIRDQQSKKRADQNPLIDMSLFRIKSFNIGLAAVVFHFMMHTSFLLLSAEYLQNGLMFSSLEVGLIWILPGLLFTLASVMAAKLVPRFGTWVLQFGLLVLVSALSGQIYFFRPHVGLWPVLILQSLYGFGNGLVLPSLLNVTLQGVHHKFAGAAAGVYSTFQQTASALGVSVIAGIFYYTVQHTGDYQKAFAYSIGASIISLIVVSILLFGIFKSGGKLETDQVAE